MKNKKKAHGLPAATDSGPSQLGTPRVPGIRPNTTESIVYE